MTASRIKSIEEKIITDASSETGRRIVGFDTYYESRRFVYSSVVFGSRNLALHTANGCAKNVQIDKQIEPLDIYHCQFGIPLSDEHNCFFITSWLKGIYCCDLDSGSVLWNYRLKHAQFVLLFDEYLVCDFQEIGLRKISYSGEEIAKYPITTYESFFALDTPYVLCGPNRGKYNIIDTQTMSIYKRIGMDIFSPDDKSIIILKVEGNCNDFTIEGFEDEQTFKRRICL